VEYLTFANDPRLREVVTFVPLWERALAYRGEGDVTFYAHAKAVTRPFNAGVTCHPWASILYHVNLDYWPLVAESLKAHPVAGAFKKVGHGFGGSSSRWHYSGTFFWARNRDVAARDWRRVDQQWWGSESWVGVHFKPDEAACLFHQGVVPRLNLYSMAYLQKIVYPELRTWTLQNAKSRSAIGSLTTSANS
jgi:hypothetical protein